MTFNLNFIRTIVYKLPLDKATQELILEALRWAVFAAISAFVSALLDAVAKVEPTSTTMILTIVLRGVDKWLYAHQKDSDKKAVSNNPTGLLGV